MPRRRLHGEGTYRKRPNGLWEWQIMLGYHPDGRRNIKSLYARTQQELRKKVKQFQDELRAKPHLSRVMPFSQWADTW